MLQGDIRYTDDLKTKNGTCARTMINDMKGYKWIRIINDSKCDSNGKVDLLAKLRGAKEPLVWPDPTRLSQTIFKRIVSKIFGGFHTFSSPGI